MPNINIVLYGENHHNATIVPFILQQLDKLLLKQRRIIFGVEQPEEFKIDEQKAALKNQYDTLEDHIKIYAIYNAHKGVGEIPRNVMSSFLKDAKTIKNETEFDQLIKKLREQRFREGFLQEITDLAPDYAGDNQTKRLYDYFQEKNISCFPLDLPQEKLLPLYAAADEQEFYRLRDEIEPDRIANMAKKITDAIHKETVTDQTDLFVFVLTGMQHTQGLKNKLNELAKSNQDHDINIMAFRFRSKTFNIYKDICSLVSTIVPGFRSSRYLNDLIEYAKKVDELHVGNQDVFLADAEINDLDDPGYAQGGQKFDDFMASSDSKNKFKK